MQVTVPIHSPRWGHADDYVFDFDKQTLTITMKTRTAKCEQVANRDPVWSGEPLRKILRNDSISAPDNLTDLIEYAWNAWRNGDLNNAQIGAELKHLGVWIDAMTAAKPASPFWRQYF